MHQYLISCTLSTLALCCFTAYAGTPILSENTKMWQPQAWSATYLTPTYPNLWRCSSHNSVELIPPLVQEGHFKLPAEQTLGALNDKERPPDNSQSERRSAPQSPWEQISTWFKQYQTT